MLESVAVVALGAFLLWLGAEWLVSGSIKLATKFKISPFFIGITIVALGTSLPEFFTSLYAHVFQNRGGIAMGNILGSNVANLALVLGGSAVIAPIAIRAHYKSNEMPWLLGFTLLLGALMFDQKLDFVDGIIILFFYVLYIAIPALKGKFKNELDKEETSGSHFKIALFLVTGCILLPAGSHFLVKGAVDIAQFFNLSDRVIGLTIIAIGTSCPELSTSIVAAWKGRSELAVGNVVGSNFFNIVVLGLIALIKPITFSYESIQFDYAAVAVLTLITFIMVYFSSKIHRWIGLAFLISYALYLGLLVF